MKIVAWLALAFAGMSAIGQIHSLPAAKPDPLPGRAAQIIRVTGTYLARPRTAVAGAAPTLMVTCAQGSVEQNDLDFKAVLAARQGSFPAMMEAHFDGKSTYIGAETISPDRKSVSLPGPALQKILHAHRVVIGADEYLGAEILIQFEMPDTTAFQDACGKRYIPEKPPTAVSGAPPKPILSAELGR